MVIFDCERLKVPDTGIFHFCLNLASALKEEAERSQDMDISFFLRKRNKGILGDDADYTIYRSIYKYVFPYHKTIRGIWHASFQFPLIMPSMGKVLLTVHDLNFLYENTPEGRAYWMSILQKNVDRASEIAVISEYTKQDLVKHIDTGNKKIHVIHNGCAVYSGPVSRPEAVPPGEFIYTIGAVTEKKNFHVLPCLLKDNDLHLVISGPDSYPYKSRIMEEASAYGVADRVHITGSVSEEEKHWWLQNCLAFVFPSIAEGFGLPVVEAMYYGKPVFLSEHTSLPEIGGDKAFYFNRDFDREQMRREFAEGMELFLKGEKTPEELRRHAESFSWNTAAKKYMEIYRSMIQSK